MFKPSYSDTVRDFLKIAKFHPTKPDLAALSLIMRAFSRLPYENFTKVIRAAAYPDSDERFRTPEIVLFDHCEFGTGGTCFSLTYLFSHVLHELGFDLYPVLCDRSYGANTHCALIVKIDAEKYLCDPGYLFDQPIRVPAAVETAITSSLRLSLTRLGTSSQLLLIDNGGEKAKIRYRLRDVPVTDELFRARWKDSFGWAMMSHLCVTKQQESGQLYMRDGLLRDPTNRGKGQEIVSENFVQRVSTAFGIDERIVTIARDSVARIRR